MRGTTFSRALLLAAGICLAPGCTLYDDYLPGTPFTPDQPVAEVTLQGEISIDRASGSTEGCPAGGTLFWGTVRNTGDVDLDEVFISVAAYDSSDNLLGSYRVNVFSGDLIAGAEEDAVERFSTSLLVDQSGFFEICSTLRFGVPSDTVARTDYDTDYTVIEDIVVE